MLLSTQLYSKTVYNEIFRKLDIDAYFLSVMKIIIVFIVIWIPDLPSTLFTINCSTKHSLALWDQDHDWPVRMLHKMTELPSGTQNSWTPPQWEAENWGYVELAGKWQFEKNLRENKKQRRWVEGERKKKEKRRHEGRVEVKEIQDVSGR